MAKRRKVSNLLALALLSLLAQRSMYPYEMAQTLRARGKEQSIKINWGSLYTVVQNLEKNGFIEATGTVREGRQPERTTYQITAAGMAELSDWMRELLSVPKTSTTGSSRRCRKAASCRPTRWSSCSPSGWPSWTGPTRSRRRDLKTWSQRLPRILLIESEYQLAMRKAQADWVRGLITEITEGTISGIEIWRQIHETGEMPAQMKELDEQALRGWDEPQTDNT